MDHDRLAGLDSRRCLVGQSVPHGRFVHPEGILVLSASRTHNGESANQAPTTRVVVRIWWVKSTGSR